MSTLIKKITLICSDVGTNGKDQHNKVWHGELFDNDLVKTSWGRVGYDLQSKEFPGVGESFLLKKQSEKIKKGYSEARLITTENTGSLSKSVSNLHEIAKSQIIKSKSPVLDTLIDRLVQSNVHRITSSTNITLNSSTGLFQTPIGIVTLDAIGEARLVLVDILTEVKKQKYESRLSALTSKYLRLIPQNIGMKFNVKNIFPDVVSVQKQDDILDSLTASYKAITATTVKPDEVEEQVFKVDLDVETGNEASRLQKWFESSKKKMHGYDNIRVKNVFKVKIHEMDKVFHRNDQKIVEVFHGTSEANCLSILKAGLKTTPPSTAAIAGSLFGSGIYGAIHSTKSLGYTYGRWGQSSGTSGWLFICQFADGRRGSI